MRAVEPVPLEKLDPANEWAPWEASREDPFNAKWAGHLCRRAGFGCSPLELADAVKNGLPATWQKLLAPAKTSRAALPSVPDATVQIRADWLQRMLSGIEPVRERLTLFWHNHFATSIAKIQDPKLMQRQNEMIRSHALGKFGPFLKAMSCDVAMLIWLDSNQNVKTHPNENFAREVMELFSLGVGNYTEKDVQGVARAFTGWHVSVPQDGERRFVLQFSEHDGGPKTIFGRTQNFDGDDVIDVILKQPACSRFLVRRLYHCLINENVVPPDSFLQPLADALRKSDYDIGALVTTMLQSRHFFSAHAYRQKIKSPIDYCVGVSRLFGTGATGSVVMSPYSLIGSLELQGQQLYQPPNVKGWEGGKAWLSTATVLARHNFAYEICNSMKGLNEQTLRITGQQFVPFVDPLALVRREGIQEVGKVVEFYGNLLVPGDLKPEVVRKLTKYIDDGTPKNFIFEQRCRDAMYALVTLPEYQLC